MSTHGKSEVCSLCKKGQMVRRSQEIAFRQWTKKGYAYCRVTIEMSMCSQCGFKYWDDHANDAMDAAVRQEYEKLP
jgi:uncharacterized protein with PIN domain